MKPEEFYYFLNLLFRYHMLNSLIDGRRIYYAKEDLISDNFGEDNK